MAANSSSGPRIQPVHGKLTATATKQEREIMKKTLLSMALAVVAPFAWGQVSVMTTTTTTTEGNGTITEYTPGSAIVLRKSSEIRRCLTRKLTLSITRRRRPIDEIIE